MIRDTLFSLSAKTEFEVEQRDEDETKTSETIHKASSKGAEFVVSVDEGEDQPRMAIHGYHLADKVTGKTIHVQAKFYLSFADVRALRDYLSFLLAVENDMHAEE
jgi:hypothetical protein